MFIWYPIQIYPIAIIIEDEMTTSLYTSTSLYIKMTKSGVQHRWKIDMGFCMFET